MAALNFPASPTNGQIHTENGKSYKYSSTSTSWLSLTGTGNGYTGSAGATGSLGYTGSSFVVRPSTNITVTSPLVWNSNNYDTYTYSALANNLTINADSGSPINGQKMLFRIKDNGSSRNLTWTTGTTNSFREVGIALPTTTTVSKVTYVGCVYNSTDSRWDVIATTTEN